MPSNVLTTATATESVLEKVMNMPIHAPDWRMTQCPPIERISNTATMMLGNRSFNVVQSREQAYMTGAPSQSSMRERSTDKASQQSELLNGDWFLVLTDNIVPAAALRGKSF